MNILPPKLVDFSKATLISAADSPRQLHRLGDSQFLVMSRNDTKVIIAIESVELEAVISDLSSEIIDVELTTSRTLICRDPERIGSQELEVRIYSRRGDVYVVHSHHGILIL